MGRIKSWYFSLPLKRAFICLVFLMALLVAGISACVISAGTAMRNHLLDTVTVPLSSVIQPKDDADVNEIIGSQSTVIADEGQVSTDENGQPVLQTIEHRLQNLSRKNQFLYHGTGVAMVAVPCLLFAVGTLLCAWMFYAIKLEKPLALLTQSADRISQNDLDFEMDYDSLDEMGRLCQVMDQNALLSAKKQSGNVGNDGRKAKAERLHRSRSSYPAHSNERLYRVSVPQCSPGQDQ